MPKSSDESQQATYEVLERWVDHCLRHDYSLFEPDRVVWSSGNLDRLRKAFTEQSDVGEGTFLERVAEQLRDSSDEVVLLFAEMLAAHLLISTAVSGARKRALITTVLDLMDEPVEIPDDVAGALDHGLINPGVAYNSYRAYQLQFFIDLLISFKDVPPERQDELLTDPWAFKDLVFSIEHHAAYTQQLAMLHMVHPDTFEPIVSRKHREAIVEAFRDRIGEVDDIDRALAEIRSELAKGGKEIDTFYDADIHRQWDPQRAGIFDELARSARLYPVDHLHRDESEFKLGIGATVRQARCSPDIAGVPRSHRRLPSVVSSSTTSRPTDSAPSCRQTARRRHSRSSTCSTRLNRWLSGSTPSVTRWMLVPQRRSRARVATSRSSAPC